MSRALNANTVRRCPGGLSGGSDPAPARAPGAPRRAQSDGGQGPLQVAFAPEVSVAPGCSGADAIRRSRGAAGPCSVNRSAPWSLRRRRSEEHTSELQSRGHLVCRLLLEKKKYDKQLL